jgi:hypothetical protein
MRSLLFLSLAICFFSVSLHAQQPPSLAYEFDEKAIEPYADQVRIHVTYVSANGWGIGSYRLMSSLQDKPIKIPNNDYLLIVTNEEEIAFFQNDRVNNLPVQLTFEKGKDYYFRFVDVLPPAMAARPRLVDELTEREFQMHLFINEISPKPIIYDFTEQAASLEQ